MTSPSAGIEVRGLTRTFGDVQAVSDLDFVVPPGSVYGLLGPNGAGKTTTLRILGTLLEPTAGDAMVNCFNVRSEERRVGKERRSRCSPSLL